ncbi:MAG: bifunctional phosphopantothenoylcysteine decarboxylase/phosphopantothenate--cysteine ligase CoaBC [Anaerorhabdus sp.]
MSKTIIIGVTGGIAAFKTCQLVSNLKKKGYDIHVIMTKNATNLIHPNTFEVLSGNRVSVDTFDRNFQYDVEHISLAKKADVFVVAPATANSIAKFTHGLADDMLSTTFLASKCKKIICPAMNTGMLENQVTQENLKKCQELGYIVVNSENGFLACGDEGQGRLADISIIEYNIEKALISEKFLHGKKILVTAGPTQEAIDPVRFITNHSSGKMGYAIAKMAALFGAEVTLVSGPVSIEKPVDVNIINVISAQDMYEEVKKNYFDQDIIIKCAAVADFTSLYIRNQKIKKSDQLSSIDLKSTVDILKYLGNYKNENQILCGFAMETENAIDNARSKLYDKNCDCIILNNLTDADAGFKKDTNKITYISKKEEIEYPTQTKEECAIEILKKCNDLKGEKDNVTYN